MRKPRRRKAGANKARLQITAAPTREMTERRRQQAAPQPVKVTYADGRVEIRNPDSFKAM